MVRMHLQVCWLTNYQFVPLPARLLWFQTIARHEIPGRHSVFVRSRAHHQILEHHENHALLLQRSSVAGQALELSYPLFGIHSIH